MAKSVEAFDNETGEVLGLVDLRGRGSKARSKANRKGRFALMYGAECEDLLTDSRLSHFEVRLFWFMIARMDWDNRLTMTQTSMARSFKVPPSQISRALHKIEASGYARCLERGVYVINPAYAYKGEDVERDQVLERSRHLFVVRDQ